MAFFYITWDGLFIIWGSLTENLGETGSHPLQSLILSFDLDKVYCFDNSISDTDL